jgi:hypothetical protein
MTYTAVTKRQTSHLDESFDDLVVDALWHASVLDNPEERTQDRQRSSVIWREAMYAIGARIASEAKAVEVWGASRPRAV